MALTTLAFCMTARDVPAPPIATGVPALFEALLDVLAPMRITVRIDGADFHVIQRNDAVRVFATQPLWADEELARGALTRCKSTLGTDVIAELCDVLAGAQPKTFYAAAECAVFHRASGTTEAAWYARARSNTQLVELAHVMFVWSEQERGFELRCPIGGYPFASVEPRTNGTLGDGDPMLAALNREAILPALLRVREAIGFDRDEVTWRIEGDFGGSCRADRKDVWERWLPRLRAS